MGQVVQTNGDYTIKALPDDRTVGGKITLDTGDNVGEVRVTGNLVVTGATLTVETANLNVQDNVIILNYGEQGAGVTLDYSGIQVDRGSLPPASFVYDENNGYWFLAAGAQPGPFSYSNDGTNPGNPRSASRLKLKEILTDSTDNGDLLLIGSGTGVLKVGDRSPGPGYETFVTDPDDIPNKQYVDNAIRDNPTFQILSDGPADPLNPLPNNATRVIVTDEDVADLGNGVSSLDYFFQNTGETTLNDRSAVSILVNGVLNSQFYSDRTYIQDLDLSDNQITINREDAFNNTNIVITVPGTGKLQTNHALQLDNWNITPSYASNATIINSKPPSIGTTGLFFSHSQGSGEFISKNKALVFSMIF